MPSGKYYRRQAQLFASLAAATSDPQIVARYTSMALEQLAKAEEVEPGAGNLASNMLASDRNEGGEIDRE